MQKFESQELTSSAARSKEHSFQITKDGCTETIFVNEELIESGEASQERAVAEFIEQSYQMTTISFETFHVDALHPGSIITADGVTCIIEKIEELLNGAEASMKITAKRYD